jgi:predicted nucleotidyltransferase
MNFGISQENLDFITQAIGNYADIDSASIFGSRAMGNYKSTSDIDISIKGNLKDTTAGSLLNFLNNASPFAYKVDVLDYNVISNLELKKHIDEFGKVIFERSRN